MSNQSTAPYSPSSGVGGTPGVQALVVQCGPQEGPVEGGAQRLADWLRPRLHQQGADLVVLSELATTPFFSVSTDKRWLSAGADPCGPELRPLAELARDFRTHLVVGFAEQGRQGELFNSAVVLGPDGEPVEGRLCSGPRAGEPALTYRKVHLSENRNTDPGVHEKYFFRPGDGFVIFETALGRLAVLICYDRSFPESWRTVRLAGARVVALPVASSRPERAGMFARELQVAAMQHGLFVLAASKGGAERLAEGAPEVTYFGASQIVSPFGETLAEGALATGPELIRAGLDLALLDAYDGTYHLMRDREPDAYRF
jgi:beta-ureidopropionase